MNLLNMSFSATILILAIIVIRILLLHKLPKGTFLVLWYVTLCRLLIPIEVSSRFSIYTVINLLKGRAPESNSNFTRIPSMPNSTLITGTITSFPESKVTNISGFVIIWLIGLVICTLFFLVTHLRWRKEYKTALPIANIYVSLWQQEHPLRRNVQIQQSDRITTPLIYGIFHPIVLLPKQTDWMNETKLRYILTHEFVHIKRFDTLTKLLMATALCVHWFNPFVWLMYILINQDIELSCDEAVVKALGWNVKSSYALTLIDLEEEKNQFSPLINNFSKNAIEERIVSIMKIKKNSLIVTLIAFIMITLVTTVFATSAPNKNKPVYESPQVTYSSENTDEVIYYPTPGELNNHSSYSEDEYATLMSLKINGYRELKISAFDSQVKKIQTIYSGYNPNDENLNFMQTLYYSTTELAFSQNNATPIIGISTGINKKTRNDEYYGAQLSYEVSWTVFDKDKTTVGQRDDTLNACQESIQSILESKNRDELNNIKIRSQLQAECNALAKELTNNSISLQITINDLIPTENQMTDFTEYTKYGLSYDAQANKLMYNGNLVRYFEDFYPLTDGAYAGTDFFDKDGTVDIHAVRDLTPINNSDGSINPAGRLTGIEQSSPHDFKARDIRSLLNPVQSEAISDDVVNDSNGGTTISTQKGNVPIANSSEGMMTPDELEKLYSVYEPFGVTYDKEKDCFYYEGKLVQTFTDILSSNGEPLESGKFSGSLRQHGFNDKGEVNIKAVRDYTKLNKDGEGKLVGIEVVE